MGAGLADNADKQDAGAVYVVFSTALPFPQPESTVGLSSLQIAGLAVLGVRGRGADRLLGDPPQAAGRRPRPASAAIGS